MTAILLALASAGTFSAADFLGGLASRRADATPVALVSQVVGFALLAVGLIVLPGTPSISAFAWGGIAGLGGAGGLIAYFRALSIGAMGLSAPMASLVGAVLPVSVVLLLGERPGLLAVVGVGLGLAATVLVSLPSSQTPRAEGQHTALLTAALAGVLFGLFFVGLDQAPDDSGLWPLVGARMTGVALIGGLLGFRRATFPRGAALRTAILSGALDMIANILFLLATREGLLVLTTAITSLYPVGVVILAWVVLSERLARSQVSGVVMALMATVLIALP